jgi:hypothetical protein
MVNVKRQKRLRQESEENMPSWIRKHPGEYYIFEGGDSAQFFTDRGEWENGLEPYKRMFGNRPISGRVPLRETPKEIDRIPRSRERKSLRDCMLEYEG